MQAGLGITCHGQTSSRDMILRSSQDTCQPCACNVTFLPHEKHGKHEKTDIKVSTAIAVTKTGKLQGGDEALKKATQGKNLMVTAQESNSHQNLPPSPGCMLFRIATVPASTMIVSESSGCTWIAIHKHGGTPSGLDHPRRNSR